MTSATTAAGAIPACGDSRRCCAASATISASFRSSSGVRGALYVDLAAAFAATRCSMGGGLFGFLAPDLVRALPARRKRRDAGLRIRPVVDGAERQLASRQPASHHLQHDVGARSRTRRRRYVRRRADGHHLHRRRCRGISAQLVRIRISAASAVPERRGRHRRRIGVGLRISRRAGLLRPSHRQLADRGPKRSGTR